MAMVFIDGFDHYATADILKVYDSQTGTPAINSSGGRNSSGALEAPNAASVQEFVRLNTSTLSSFVTGFAFKPDATPTGSVALFATRDSGSFQLSVGINSSRNLIVFRGTTVIATSTEVVPLDVFSYVEFKGTINNTTGSYEVILDDVSVLSASGTDTQDTGNANFDAIDLGLMGTPGVTITCTYEDFYFLDDTGSVNNDFLGDVRVELLLPDVDGNYTDYTPSTGVDHFALVDETPPNTTDFNSNATATNKDSYGMADLSSSSSTIHGVQVSSLALKTDAGARSAKVGVRSGTTDNVSASQALTTSYLYYHNIHETDPDTALAWTDAGVNAVETLVETV